MAEATLAVHDHGSLYEEPEGPNDAGAEDPRQEVAATRRETVPGPEAAQFERLREFMVSRQASGGRSWRPRREMVEEDEDGNATGDRSNSGPAPFWDGTTAFKDYQMRAKPWLATT